MKQQHPQYSVRSIFTDNNNWEKYKSLHRNELKEYQIKAVDSMLKCCDPSKGFFYYYCRHCDLIEKKHVSCNSSFCTRCGKKYVDKWSNKTIKRMPNVTYSHIVFTLPSDLWLLIKDKWDCFRELSIASYRVMKELMSEKAGQEITSGMISSLQTYGEDIKYNVHLHNIITDGGLTAKEKAFKEVYYFPYEKLRKKWQEYSLRTIQKYVKEDIEKYLYWYPKGFNVRRIKAKIKKKELLGYIARYLRHPPISNRRIINYDGNIVKIVCEDDNGKNFYVTFTTEKFIGDLVQHIPKKGFKVIRSFGIFSRRKYKVEFKTKRIIVEVQEIITKYSDANCGVRCSKCGRIMELLGFYSPAYTNKPPPEERIQQRVSDWIS